MNVKTLIDQFERRGTQEVIVDCDDRVSYGGLYQSIDKLRRSFEQRETRFIFLRSDYSQKAISYLLALLSLNKVVCPLSHEFPLSHQIKNLEDLGGELVIDIKDNSVEYINIGERAEQDIPELLREFYRLSVPGLVILTSGTSGRPKAALYNFNTWLRRFDDVKERLDSRAPLFLKFSHLGGLQTLFYQLCCGGACILLKSRRPDEIMRLLSKKEITFLPITPSFLTLLDYQISQNGEALSFPEVRLISLGAEPMHRKNICSVEKYFPNAKTVQTYGLTETGTLKTLTTQDPRFVKFNDEVNQYRVVDGKLEVKSPYMMIGYLNAESPFTEDGFLKTGDSVLIQDGALRITGRVEDRINIGGEKVSPIEVEDVIHTHPQISDVLVYGESHPLLGQVVCAKIVSPSLTKHDLGEVKKFCLNRLEKYKIPVSLELVDEIPLNNNLKKER